MSESSEFTPPMAEPLQLLDCFTTPKAKKIADGWFAFNILKCHYCSLTQKRKNAKKSAASKLKSHMMIVSFITFFH
ncbi:unnamed protein product [Pocillopora meandrina]|uniref:BED-type domain-containing protein n=1 Tax=Pocillopora meandrina TaxID=46732 RepID=A0AAU9WS81_9CNID|nr:unnamed protein product [Pocillopora meandrina]